MSGWIGVDLDGTLAQYGGWKGHMHVGAPVPKMVDRVLNWCNAGKDVRIVTARVAGIDDDMRTLDRQMAEGAKDVIEDWCREHLNRVLPITNKKDYGMVELWDDRAVQVIPNTGVRADGGE